MGEPVDAYNPLEKVSGKIKVAEAVELAQGKHEISLEVAGKNEKASGLRVGLDYVKLERATE